MGSVVLAGATSGSTTITPTDAVTATVTLPSTGGTLQTSGAGFTTNGVAYASSTSALATGNRLIFDGTNLGLGATPKTWVASNYCVFGIGDAGVINSRLGISTYSIEVGVNWYRNSGGTYVYNFTGYGTNYVQSDGSHAWYNAPSGTAGNTITFTQAMTLTASGNLGIGTTTPAKTLDVSYSSTSTTATTAATMQLVNPQNAVGYYSGVINFCRINSTSPMAYIGSIQIDTTGNSANGLVFGTRNGTSTVDEKMRLSADGSLLVGTTTAGGWQGNARGEFYSDAGTFANAGGVTLSVYHAGANSVATNIRVNSTSVYFMQFQYNGATTVGAITTNGSSTTYATSSDYRLKEDIAPMTGALTKVAQLKPVTYKWKADGSDSQGFIAHELAEVCPQAVTGEKDAVDKDGNPKYQGIDTSFLVATLTSAIQEQQTLIESLTARLTALENK